MLIPFQEILPKITKLLLYRAEIFYRVEKTSDTRFPALPVKDGNPGSG